MLPAASRITKPGDFSRIYKSGRRVGTKRLRIFFVRRAGKSRFGFVISKKSTKVGAAAGKIVQRNRIKRLLRDEARRVESKITGGHDIVIQVREGLAKLPAEAVRSEFREALTKASLLKS